MLEHNAVQQPGPPLHVRAGEVVLLQGHVNYTDNFARPNYGADLVDITGTIGAFGTAAREPASIDISANLAGNGPISIRGTVNPLADKPSIDVSASALRRTAQSHAVLPKVRRLSDHEEHAQRR